MVAGAGMVRVQRRRGFAQGIRRGRRRVVARRVLDRIDGLLHRAGFHIGSESRRRGLGAPGEIVLVVAPAHHAGDGDGQTRDQRRAVAIPQPLQPFGLFLVGQIVRHVSSASV